MLQRATKKGTKAPTCCRVGCHSGFSFCLWSALILSVAMPGGFCESWNSQMRRCPSLFLHICLHCHGLSMALGSGKTSSDPRCIAFLVSTITLFSWSFLKRNISPHLWRTKTIPSSQEFKSSASTKLTKDRLLWTVPSTYMWPAGPPGPLYVTTPVEK